MENRVSAPRVRFVPQGPSRAVRLHLGPSPGLVRRVLVVCLLLGVAGVLAGTRLIGASADPTPDQLSRGVALCGLAEKLLAEGRPAEALKLYQEVLTFLPQSPRAKAGVERCTAVAAVPLREAADWPRWRGPSGNGVAGASAPLADRWPRTGPRKLWQAHPLALAAAPYAGGYGSPVVAEGRVFLYLHDRGRNEDRWVCVDAHTGATIWTQRASASETMHGASGTPCVSDGRVYTTGARKCYCLDAQSGAIIWERDTGVPAKDPTVSSWNQEVSSSPVFAAGVVAVMLGPFHGLDARTSRVAWTAPESGGYSGTMTSPAVWTRAGRPRFVYCGYRRMCAVDAVTGTVLWDLEGNAGPGDYTPTPAVEGDYLAVHWRGSLGAYHLTETGAKRLWAAPLFDRHSSPIVHAGRVYYAGHQREGADPALVCRDLTSGQVLWTQPIGDPEFSSPLYAGGKIILLTDRGKRLTMVDAATGGLPAEGVVGARQWASPAMAAGRLFVRIAEGGLACYDLTAEANAGPPRPVLPCREWRNPVDGMEFICVPGGEGGADFWLGKREVTVAEFAKFAAATGYRIPAETRGWGQVYDGVGFSRITGASWRSPHGPADQAIADHPVVHVSKEDARAYCIWASGRLPTSREWETAARGGLVGTEFSWGDEWPPPRGSGNFADESARRRLGWNAVIPGYDDGYPTTAPVGKFAPNGYGLFDMLGNVWEWVTEDNLLRGGGFCQSVRGPGVAGAVVGGEGTGQPSDNVGFRVARDLLQPQPVRGLVSAAPR